MWHSSSSSNCMHVTAVLQFICPLDRSSLSALVNIDNVASSSMQMLMLLTLANGNVANARRILKNSFLCCFTLTSTNY